MESEGNEKFLDPRTISLIGNFEVISKLIVDGFFAGRHKGSKNAISLEYSKHRDYYPGDPLKLVDWKLYGKSDRFFVKQFQEETNLEAWMLLDMSQSMAFSGKKSPVTKLQYATYLVAALTYLMLSQNDKVGLILFDEKIRKIIRPGSTRKQLHVIIRELQNLKAGSKSNFEEVAKTVASRIKRRGMMILFSDLLAHPEKAESTLKQFLRRGSELMICHILSYEEIEFPYKRFGYFEDMETQNRVLVAPEVFREEYKKQMAAYLATLRKICVRLGMNYQLLQTTTHFDRALEQFLKSRERMM